MERAAASRRAGVGAPGALRVSPAVGPGTPAADNSAADRAGRPIPAAAPSVSAPAVMSPAITCAIEASIPTEMRRPPGAKVRMDAPAPQPRRGKPGPAHPRRIYILVWRIRTVDPFIDILLAIGHPYPAILAGIDPLTGLARRSRLLRRGGSRLLPVVLLAGALQDADAVAGALLQDADLIVVPR